MTVPEGKSTDPSSSKRVIRRGMTVLALFILLGAGYVVFNNTVPAWISKEIQKAVERDAAFKKSGFDAAVKIGEEYPDSPTERLRRQ